MLRKLRLQYPGAIYHLMNRGDRRDNIFEDDEDRHRYLKFLAEANTMHERRGDYYGPELREADQVHAERILKEQLRERGWTEADLGCRRKGDPEKVQIASQLRAQTTMTLKWIARRFKMGTWTHVSNCLVLKRKKEKNVNSYD